MTVRILTGDCRDVLRTLEADSVDCVITSPPYWGLRDYGVDGQIGLESDFNAYVEKMVSVFGEVRRVLRKDGTCWLNLGDSYNGYMANQRGTGLEVKRQQSRKYIEPGAGLRTVALKAKDLVGIPWRVAFALQADGWYLRQDIIWSKPNPMPESVTDRCTKAHEYLFLLSKSERYYFDQDAILEPCSPSTHARLSQDVQNQVGSERAHAGGKTNGNMKAVARKSEGTPRQDGDRWNENNGKGFLPRASGNKSHKAVTEYENSDSEEHRTKAGLLKISAIAFAQRNKRSVWTIPTQGFSEAHFATFPPALVEPCILAGCPVGGTILDPFGGAGTVGLVADRLERNAILIELNPAYADMASKRVEQDCPMFAQVTA